MNFTKMDMVILLGSLMFVIFMSISFPAMGLASDNSTANQTKIPNLDIDNSTIELVGERPAYPRSPTSGELRYNTERNSNWQVVIEREEDTTDSGFNDYVYFLETFVWNNDPANENAIIQLTHFEEGSLVNEANYTITQSDFNNSNIETLSAGGYEIQTTFEDEENWNTSDLEYRITWDIQQSPDTDSGFLDNIPLVGGGIDTINAIASVLGWAVKVFFWFFAWIFELVLTAISILLEAILFLINLGFYIITNMSSLISNTTGFVSFILLIPVIAMTLEIGKIVLMFIKVLPTT